MLKTDLCFGPYCNDLENNIRPFSLIFFFYKTKGSIPYVPNDFFIWDNFCNVLSGAVNARNTVGELRIDPVGISGIWPDHHPLTFLIAAVTSAGVLSTTKTAVKLS